MQAALLNTKLSHLVELTQDKVRITERYLNEIKCSKITLPTTRENDKIMYIICSWFNVWSVMLSRDIC
jgi:dTDP-4-amino-4,6-dideoxygalactose transaminase